MGSELILHLSDPTLIHLQGNGDWDSCVTDITSLASLLTYLFPFIIFEKYLTLSAF